MEISPRAGKAADPSLLINVPRLVSAYYTGRPDPSVPAQRVVFGTSGHRGSALLGSIESNRALANAKKRFERRFELRNLHEMDAFVFPDEVANGGLNFDSENICTVRISWIRFAYVDGCSLVDGGELHVMDA